MGKLNHKKFLKKMVRKHKRKVGRLRNHPFVVPVVTILAMFFITSIVLVAMNGRTVQADDTHIVVLSIDGKSQTLPTRAQSVDDFLKRANIRLSEGDIVEPTGTTPIAGDQFRVNVYHAEPVTIVDAGKKTTIKSAYREPREIAAKAGIEVFPEDFVAKTPADDVVKEGILGIKIVIQHSVPVNLNLYGQAFTLRTRAKTVGDLLKEKGARVEGNNVLPAPETPITPQLLVFVVSPGKQIENIESTIPAPVETVNDSTLSAGTTAVRQEGSAGKKVVTSEVDTKTGERKTIQEITTVEPVKRIIAKGTRSIALGGSKGDWAAAAGVSSADYFYVDYIIGRESGWCPTKWQGQYGSCPGYYEELHSPSSGYGYGLCQSTPAGKMSSAGADWATNPVTQLRWCAGYAQSRYGGWANAYSHWVNYNNW